MEYDHKESDCRGLLPAGASCYQLAMLAHDLGVVIIGLGPILAYITWLERGDKHREAWLLREKLPVPRYLSDKEIVKRWAIGIVIFLVSLWASQQ